MNFKRGERLLIFFGFFIFRYMITSVTMVRKMGNFEVLQRTKDGYFDANSLLTQWNSVKGNTRRRKDDFLNSVKTKEFIEVLESEIAFGEKRPMAIYDKKGRILSLGFLFTTMSENKRMVFLFKKKK